MEFGWLFWVKTGKAQCEHMFSVAPQQRTFLGTAALRQKRLHACHFSGVSAGQ
jgi:hypothetical protein